MGSRPRRIPLPVGGIDAVLLAPLQNGMARHETPRIKDPDLVGELMNLDKASRPIGHAVVVAADGHQAVMAHPALELDQRVEGTGRQRLQLGLLSSEGFRDDAVRGAMQANVRHRVEPASQFGVQIMHVAERTAEEEVLADVAERPLDLALGFAL